MDIPQDVLENWARECRNGCGVTCGNRPCDACCAGGICDEMPCECEDDYDLDDDSRQTRDFFMGML